MCARDRLLEFVAYKNISKREFYVQADLSSGFLTKNKNIGSDKIRKILLAYPELRVEWVVMGSGSMLHGTEDAKKPDPKDFLPLVDIATMVKEPELTYGDTNLEILDLFSLGKSCRDCSLAVQVWGNSMRPEFCPGDIAVLRKMNRIEYLQWGFTHLLITEEQQFFRRVQRSPDKDKLRLFGCQVEDEFFEVKKADIVHVYEVRAMVRKLML